MMEWTRPKGYASDYRTVKVEVLDLLRLLHALGIKTVIKTEFGYALEHVRIIRS